MNKRNFGKAAGLAGLSLLLFGCAAGGSQYSPEQVLSQALEEQEGIQAYYGEAQVTTSEGDKVIDQYSLKEWVSADGKRRIDLVNSEGDSTEISVNTGTAFISYQPLANKAMRFDSSEDELSALTPMSPKQQAEHLLSLIRDTHAISAGQEAEIAGRVAHHLIATANEEGKMLGDQEIWVDKENWMILKNVSSSGNLTIDWTYTMVDFEAEITDDLFELELPEDVEWQDLSIKDPKELTLDEAIEYVGKPFSYIPETDGLAIERIEVMELQGEWDRAEVTIEYVKEGVPHFSVTVFEASEQMEEESASLGEEKITIRGQEGSYLELNEFRSLVWQEEGLSYSVILAHPELTADEFIELSEKMIVAE
ncbi:LolA family protein [Halalkalibacter oceani]|uniref:LolA family protein n=1 Tax=Halalkalibacter oceani TaxID=1653776 RepID=UPI0033962FAC